MHVLELFAGIGGISLGLERAGMKTVAMVEINRACRFWLRSNYPDIPILGDIHSVTKMRLQRNGIEAIDLIAGGFPCQPHSVAGKRKGQQDARHLWPEFARLVREIRPRWVLAENVPGIRTTAADEVLVDLDAAGYSCWPLVVGADNVGAPHRRKRVWFVGRFRLADSEPGWRLKSRGRRQPYRSMEATTVEGGQYVARPGEPQYEWEATRLTQPRMGVSVDGLPPRLARSGAAARRTRLKALGNAVVPQVAEAIGRAILRLDTPPVAH